MYGSLPPEFKANELQDVIATAEKAAVKDIQKEVGGSKFVFIHRV